MFTKTELTRSGALSEVTQTIALLTVFWAGYQNLIPAGGCHSKHCTTSQYGKDFLYS